MGKRSDGLSVGLCHVFFFLPASLFLPEPLQSFLFDEKVPRLPRTFFGGGSGGCWRWKVDVVITSRFLSSLLKRSRARAHSRRFLQS